ncbi:MAG TPA: NUDIX domain-containing protein [Alphaproteobacteria bacterium]
MMTDIIKVKAYALIRRAGEVLLEPITTAEGDVIGYRALGGEVEFGELAGDAIKREFIEELGEDIIVGDLFCTSEDVYEYNGHPGHEAAFIYEAEFVNKDLYDQDKIVRVDTLHNIPVHAAWIDPQKIPDNLPLWPEDFARDIRKK